MVSNKLTLDRLCEVDESLKEDGTVTAFSDPRRTYMEAVLFNLRLAWGNLRLVFRLAVKVRKRYYRLSGLIDKKSVNLNFHICVIKLCFSLVVNISVILEWCLNNDYMCIVELIDPHFGTKLPFPRSKMSNVTRTLTWTYLTIKLRLWSRTPRQSSLNYPKFANSAALKCGVYGVVRYHAVPVRF